MRSSNPIRKEKLENLKKASSLPFGKRMAYYFDFFKFYILGILFAGVVIYIIITQIILAPKVILNGYLVNRSEPVSVTDSEFISSFPLYSQIDQNKYRIYFSSDVFLSEYDQESTVKIVTTATSGDVDYFICNEKTFNNLSQMGLVKDLNTVPEIKDKYRDAIKTYDHTTNNNNEDDSLGITANGIDITDSTVLKSLKAFKDNEKVFLCIAVNAETDDVLKDFIKWIASSDR